MDGASLTPEEAARRIAELEAENAKLRKINKVLIDRVERSMDLQGNAFSLFQTAIVLEARVRERTHELEQTLHALEKSNQALRQAKDEAETAQLRLAVAIEAISEGFLLCDADDTIVMCNEKYRELWPGLGGEIRPGMSFTALYERAQMLGLVGEEDALEESSLRRRLQYHRQARSMFVLKLATGRWLQVNERATGDGGRVAIYTDITEIKLSEQRQREVELAEKSRLLQAVFDSVSQGISLFDSSWSLAAWNQRFVELLNLDPDEMRAGTPVQDLMHLPAIQRQFPASGGEALPSGEKRIAFEQIGVDGRVLEVSLSMMPDGGVVSTYTDITERKRSEWALRDSEQRLRLITDALPALIAYVDSSQRYRFTNKPYEDWFGRPRTQINGRHMRSVIGPDIYDARREYVDAVLAGQRVTFELSLPLVRGRIEYAVATFVPHFGPEGEVLGFFALIQDITERRKAAEQLREAKETLERRVVERTAELTALNLQLKQEVEERRQAEDAASRAKAEAEQANMSKTKFIAAASHDLLQPLNAARVFVAALGESRMAARNRQLVNNLNQALAAVDDLLSALFDISKLDSGAQTPEISDFQISDVLRPLIAEYAPQVKGRGLALRWVPCKAVVRSDPTLVARMLRNFISNAMRYTPQGGILVGCRRRPEGLAISVCDTGIGIPGDKLAIVFQEFQRLAVDSHGRDRGMGLGLAIVERIARRLGHPVEVRSQLGRGSSFSIVLPYGQQPVRTEEAASPLPPTVDLMSGTRVLVVENDAAALEAMSMLLERWRCQVVTAADGQAAVAGLAELGGRPDVLVADYHLDDDRTGLEALAMVQQACGGPALPGIIITADRTDEVLKEARDAGYHLLNKPLKPARFRSLLVHLTKSEQHVGIS